MAPPEPDASEQRARQKIDVALLASGARRVLFLVDRANLGEQAEKAFVDQDPTDEPASAFLACIRGAPRAQPAATSQRRPRGKVVPRAR